MDKDLTRVPGQQHHSAPASATQEHNRKADHAALLSPGNGNATLPAAGAYASDDNDGVQAADAVRDME
ncbi:hypothetical protein ABBQ38_003698 [Trebouxia sp. C0009 RCD-2024]